MKKQYTFILLITLILLISYAILLSTYKDYKIKKTMKEIETISHQIETDIEQAKSTIQYKTSRAFRNKILKEQQSFKNRGETIISFTSEDSYKSYTKPLSTIEREAEQLQVKEKNEIYEMTIYERWMYFLFEKKS